jgi:hypothetical protein
MAKPSVGPTLYHADQTVGESVYGQRFWDHRAEVAA